MRFAGEIVVCAPASEQPAIAKALRSALCLIGSIGAQKAVGFGVVVGTPELVQTSTRPLAGLSAAARRPIAPVGLRMTFDRAFLVDATAEAGNLFVGASVVPGGVVKGALAQRLELAGAQNAPGVQALLSDMRVTHAYPENASGAIADRALPLSLVMAKTASGTFLVGDALCDTPPPDASPDGFPAALLGGQAATFASDWKPGWEEYTRAQVGLCSSPHLVPEVRVHTAIDRDSGTAEDRKLFVTAALQPFHVTEVSGVADGDAMAWRLSLLPSGGRL